MTGFIFLFLVEKYRIPGGVLRRDIDALDDCIQSCTGRCKAVDYQNSTMLCYHHGEQDTMQRFGRSSSAQLQDTACEQFEDDEDFTHYRKTICTNSKFYLLYFKEFSGSLYWIVSPKCI